MFGEFVIRVDQGYVSKVNGAKDRLLTFSLLNARRCSRSEAMDLACMACTVFPKAKVFIAHESCPDIEFDLTNPPEFVVSVGRKYLKSLKNGSVHLSYRLDEASRYPKADGFDVVAMLQLTWPDRTVYMAHFSTPFLPIVHPVSKPKERSEEGNSPEDFPRSENDDE